MRDVLGWRCKFGVIGPSTNTIVQPDFEMMRPAGVTNHYSRIFTPNAQAVSNDTFMAGTQVIGQNVLEAVRSVMTCSPDYLVMGMSAITFFGGAKGADDEQTIQPCGFDLPSIPWVLVCLLIVTGTLEQQLAGGVS